MQKYQREKVLGEGTFGVVFKAINRQTNEIVAVKSFKPVAGTFRTMNDCKNLPELRSLTKLKHDNVVRLKEVIRERDNTVHMVFEFLSWNLNTINREGNMTDIEVQSTIEQLLKGMDYIHKQGFMHRDMKPDNVMASKDESGKYCYKIGDFGCAREIRSRPPFTAYIGTRWYRAPELLLGSPHYTNSIDIWALGCIFAELLSGRPLLPGRSDVDMLIRICRCVGNLMESSWPEGMRLMQQRGVSLSSIDRPGSSVRSESMAYISLEDCLKDCDPNAISLVKQMLTWNPTSRISAADALKHPYFSTKVEASPRRLISSHANRLSMPERPKGAKAGIMSPKKEYTGFNSISNSELDALATDLDNNSTIQENKLDFIVKEPSLKSTSYKSSATTNNSNKPDTSEHDKLIDELLGETEFFESTRSRSSSIVPTSASSQHNTPSNHSHAFPIEEKSHDTPSEDENWVKHDFDADTPRFPKNKYGDNSISEEVDSLLAELDAPVRQPSRRGGSLDVPVEFDDGIFINYCEEDLIKILKTPPKQIPGLHTVTRFKSFFRGISASKINSLMDKAFAEFGGSGSPKALRRLRLLDGCVV